MAARRERRGPRLAPVDTRTIDGTLEDHDEWRDATIDGDASGAVARAVAITGCLLRNVRLTGADLEALSISNSVLEDCELSGVMAERLELSQCELVRCRMDGLVAGRGRFRDVRFVECALRDSSLRMTTWQRSELHEVELARADFTGAVFDDACSFTRCDLSGALFWDTTMAGVVLFGSPSGFARAAQCCWAADCSASPVRRYVVHSSIAVAPSAR